MLYILELVLVLLFLVSYKLQDNNYISPSCIFIFSFAFSCAWGIAYKNVWDLNLNINTFMVISAGAILFLLSSFLVHYLFKQYAKSNSHFLIDSSFNHYKQLSTYKEYLFIIFIIITIVITVRDILLITNESNISHAINVYRNAHVYSNNAADISPIAYYFGILVRAAGYWYAYYIGFSLGNKKVLSARTYFAFILCLLFSLLSGGRNDMVCMFIATIFIGIYSRTRNQHKLGQELDLKTSFKVLILVVLGILAFAYLTSLIGRNVAKSNYLYYVAVYCGAPIKNLDMFLSRPIIHSEIWGQYTFINMLRYLGIRFGLDTSKISVVLPYNYINGLELGNVYTIYFALIKDFGYLGMIALVIVMALISQTVFETMKITYPKSNLLIIIYGFFVGLLALSYFSNKFFESVIDMNFIKYIICWLLINAYYNNNIITIKFSN